MSKKTTAIILVIISLTALFSGISAMAEPQESSVTLSATASGMSLTVNSIGTGFGSFTYDVSEPYSFGEVVTITAIPDSGNQFSGWTGDVISTESSITLTMDEAHEVTAEFTLDIVSFTLDKTTLDFGEVVLGTVSDPISIYMSNTGNVDLAWSLSIVESEPFFADYLILNGGNPVNPSSVMGMGKGFGYQTSYTLDLTSAPDTVVSSDAYTGTLIYWAEAA